MPEGLSRQDIVDALDAFYSTVENLSIPVKDAIVVSAMKVEGVDESAIRAWIAHIRSDYLRGQN
jgi:hypothetical protein